MTWEDFWADALHEFDNQKAAHVPETEKESQAFRDAMKKAWQAGLSPQEAVGKYLRGETIP